MSRGKMLCGALTDKGAVREILALRQRGNHKLFLVMLSLKYLLRHFSNMENVNEHTWVWSSEQRSEL